MIMIVLSAAELHGRFDSTFTIIEKREDPFLCGYNSAMD